MRRCRLPPSGLRADRTTSRSASGVRFDDKRDVDHDPSDKTMPRAPFRMRIGDLHREIRNIARQTAILGLNASPTSVSDPSTRDQPLTQRRCAADGRRPPPGAYGCFTVVDSAMGALVAVLASWVAALGGLVGGLSAWGGPPGGGGGAK